MYETRRIAYRRASSQISAVDRRPTGTARAASTRRRGFTLIELMVVIATLGAILAIAIPSLQKYVYRSQRNEAYLNLNGIYKAQMTSMIENGQYGTTFDEIGFEILGGNQLDPNTIESRYYTYTLNTFAVDGVPNANYTAVATGDLDPSDSMLDILMIESDLIIVE